MISPNKLIGSVVLRTMDALNKDAAFLEGLKAYEFWPNCVKDEIGRAHV